MKWGVEQPCDENITEAKSSGEFELNCGGLHQVIQIRIIIKLFCHNFTGLLNDPGKLWLVFSMQ